jgi:hypothetical protein
MPQPAARKTMPNALDDLPLPSPVLTRMSPLRLSLAFISPQEYRMPQFDPFVDIAADFNALNGGNHDKVGFLAKFE